MDARSTTNFSVPNFLKRFDSMSAVRGRESKMANVWIFDSPKNGKRIGVEGDLAFVSMILYEGDFNIEWYRAEPCEVWKNINNKPIKFVCDVCIHYIDGHEEWIKFVTNDKKDHNSAEQNFTGEACEMPDCVASQDIYRVVRRSDVEKRLIEFDNWLLLCSALTRARGFSRFAETDVLYKTIIGQGECSIGKLLKTPNIDPAMMLAAIAEGLIKNQFECNITKQLISLETTISRANVKCRIR